MALTDANLLLGRILPAHFPRTFGPNQDQPLDPAVVERKFRELAATVNDRLGATLSPRELALGCVKIANEIMAKPIKEISVARGFDIRTHALVCFGRAAAHPARSIRRALRLRQRHPASAVAGKRRGQPGSAAPRRGHVQHAHRGRQIAPGGRRQVWRRGFCGSCHRVLLAINSLC